MAEANATRKTTYHNKKIFNSIEREGSNGVFVKASSTSVRSQLGKRWFGLVLE